MADLNVMEFTVTGFEVSEGRRHVADHDAFSITAVRLELQGTAMSEAHRPIPLALIDFIERPADSNGNIGTVHRFFSSDHDCLDVGLPAAAFDKYWKILTLVQRPHLRCVTPLHSAAIQELTLSSAEFHPGEGF